MDLSLGTMNKSDLREELSKREDFTRMKAEEVVNFVSAEMANTFMAFSQQSKLLSLHFTHYQ